MLQFCHSNTTDGWSQIGISRGCGGWAVDGVLPERIGAADDDAYPFVGGVEAT